MVFSMDLEMGIEPVNLLNTNQLLYHLSYSSIYGGRNFYPHLSANYFSLYVTLSIISDPGTPRPHCSTQRETGDNGYSSYDFLLHFTISLPQDTISQAGETAIP